MSYFDTGVTNVFRVNVSTLDVGAFLEGGRLIYPVVALVFAALILRVKKPWALLALALMANAHVWFVTTYPLRRPYAFGVGADRVVNLALSQVGAAGNSPLETFLVGQTHLEPPNRPHYVPWVALVSILSGWSPDRLFDVYALLPLLTAWAFALAVGFGLRRDDENREEWRWSCALAALAATLLSSAPHDGGSTYRTPWAMMFLLKPNHAVGLIWLPWLLSVLGRARSTSQRLLAAVLLHAMAWSFVLHAVYAAVGLVAFVALGWRRGAAEWRRDVRDVLGALAPNLAVAAPFAYLIVAGGQHTMPEAGAVLPPAAHFLEISTAVPLLFATSLWGASVLMRTGGRLGRLLVGQLVGAVGLWVLYFGLSAARIAHQPDEIFLWTRFVMGIVAGFGAFDLVRRAVRSRDSWLALPARRAALLQLALVPWSIPYWWNPETMDRYFAGSLQPLSESQRLIGAFLRHGTDRQAVVACEPYSARWVAALGARRVLWATGWTSPPDSKRRMDALETLVRSTDSGAVASAARSYGVEYLVVTQRLLLIYGVTQQQLEARPWFERAFFAHGGSGESVAVYRIKNAAREISQRTTS